VARFYPIEGQIQRLDTPVTLTQLQRLVGTEIEIVDLRTDDVLIVQKDSWFKLPINTTASSIAGLKPPVCGPAIILSPDDIA
jgi:hypothetical protein